jgi:hypothetical protein
MDNLTTEELVEAANQQSAIIGNLSTEKLILQNRVRARDEVIARLQEELAAAAGRIAELEAGSEAPGDAE